jgi:hypothetical protein
MLLFIIIVLSMIIALYRRYIPVTGVKAKKEYPTVTESIEILDVRDYNKSFNDPVPLAVNLPIAYIKRNWNELSGTPLHVIASTKVEKNLSIRLLRRKGYRVTGYTLTDKQSPLSQSKGKGYCYGV